MFLYLMGVRAADGWMTDDVSDVSQVPVTTREPWLQVIHNQSVIPSFQFSSIRIASGFLRYGNVCLVKCLKQTTDTNCIRLRIELAGLGSE